MKNAIFAGFFGLLALGALAGIARATNAGIWLACVLAFIVCGMLAYACAEEAGK